MKYNNNEINYNNTNLRALPGILKENLPLMKRSNTEPIIENNKSNKDEETNIS
jgi:hypothetical protein